MERVSSQQDVEVLHPKHPPLDAHRRSFHARTEKRQGAFLLIEAQILAGGARTIDDQ